MIGHQAHHAGALLGIRVLGLEGQQVVVVSQLAAGFPAGIETRILVRALAMQGEQPETLALVPRRLLALRRHPVRENLFAQVEVFGRVAGAGRAAGQRVETLIDLLEISDFADRKTKGFSQGQRTKVAIARSLVHSPQNVILDEPSNGLDVMATRSLRDVILKLKKAGHCVLFSSHVMQEVAALCDDIVIIANGKVAIDDSADGIRNRTGCDDLEDAFVKAIQRVEPAS